MGNPHSDDVAEQAIPLLTANPSVSEFTAIAGGDGGATIQVGDQPVGIFGVTTVKGSVLPPLTAGRAPSGPDEIALGDATLRKLHKAVGDRIAAVGGGEPRTMRITGRIVLDPSVVNDAVRLGEGGIVTTEALQALGIDVATNVFLIRLAPGIDRAEALGQLRTDFPGTVLLAVRPPDVENLRRVDHLPTLLALLFAIVALLTVGHTLVSSVRRRRRELAVLRAMGFVRRQVSSAVAWQATTVVALGLLIGVPTGVGVGRVVWMAVDRALGLPPDAVIPVVVLALVVPVALAAANAVAAVPGILAGRARPAIILRTE